MNKYELIGKFKGKINNLMESITILVANNKDEPALILFYCLVDQLSWLSCEKEFSNGTDFRVWVKKYLNLDLLNCNEDDLWNHRCALTHMGTSRSNQYKSERHFQLGFYKNITLSSIELEAQQAKFKYPTKLVNLVDLLAEFNVALDKFLLEIAKDEILRNRLLAKVNEMTFTFT